MTNDKKIAIEEEDVITIYDIGRKKRNDDRAGGERRLWIINYTASFNSLMVAQLNDPVHIAMPILPDLAMHMVTICACMHPHFSLFLWYYVS